VFQGAATEPLCAKRLEDVLSIVMMKPRPAAWIAPPWAAYPLENVSARTERLA
jgi:hypothetical protein